MKKFSPLLAMAVALTGAASAQAANYSTGFEGTSPLAGWTVTGSTAVSTAHAFAGTQSLYVPSTGTAYLPITGMSGGGRVTMEIFDQGNYTDKGTRSGSGTTGDPYVYSGVSYDNGYRFGVSASTNGSTGDTAMMLIDQRTYVNGNSYSYSTTGSGGSMFSDFFSPGSHGNLREATLSATPNDASFGTGRWSEWEFIFDGAGNVTFGEIDNTTGLRIANTMTETVAGGVGLNSIFIYGGATNLNGGVFVDNVTFVAAVPEPASLSLLALAAAPLLLRRRRRA